MTVWNARNISLSNDPNSAMSVLFAEFYDDSDPPIIAQLKEPDGRLGMRATDWYDASAYPSVNDVQLLNWEWKIQNTLWHLTNRDAKRAASPPIDPAAVITLTIATPDNIDPAVKTQNMAAGNVVRLSQELQILSGAGLAAGDPTYDLKVGQLSDAQAVSADAITARAAVDQTFAAAVSKIGSISKG